MASLGTAFVVADLTRYVVADLQICDILVELAIFVCLWQTHMARFQIRGSFLWAELVSKLSHKLSNHSNHLNYIGFSTAAWPLPYPQPFISFILSVSLRETPCPLW